MKNKRFNRWLAGFVSGVSLFAAGASIAVANNNVAITRFWHNHQPIYWPEWNSGVGQDSRVQYAHDSMRLKPTQNYGAAWNHPHNDLQEIFGNQDRISAYQGRPRDSVSNIGQAGGMAMSYSGSLIDNIRNLAANGWNYGGNWNSGNTEARQWTTPSGGPRMDMVGFAYHHSLTPLLPKEVFRKEVQIFKQAWWKAWGGNPNLSDHSKGFFPTEMAYSRDIVDVLVDEGYDWVIVASHHISRTSPSYMDRVTPNFNINSSPPNRADMIGPRFDNASQWWRDEPNPGQAAWNVAPFAYQLHRVQYVNPNNGNVKSMIAVPSDDVLSYQAGYSGAQIGLVDSKIAPFATDPNRPVIVMPATDGDNAWGGGFTSWMESTPAFFGSAQSRGYRITSIQDFVNQHGAAAPTTHIEEGAWIYPEMCYGSPYFLKWIEPPVRLTQNSPTTYPNTVIDIENGWSLKFFAYAPKMAGANWVITAEQILRAEGGDVQAWKIQAPYDWDGTWTSPNQVELAWHIYLKGLDSGFQYYGGLGNDDETKPGLAARRAIETLQSYMSTRMHLDQTGPTVLKPQRFPYNPGARTFGWFNRVPEADQNFLKTHPSQFYIWTLAHDVSGIQSVNLKIRHTHDNNNFRNGHNHNLTYAGGANVASWTTIPMTRRVLPNTRAELNAIANHNQIDFVVTSPEIADQYFVKIDDTVYPNFRNRYFDYYIEAVDTRGNISRSEIQHVFVEDDGQVPSSGVQFSADPRDCAPLGVTYFAANGVLEGVSPVVMQLSFDNGATWTPYTMTSTVANVWNYTVPVPGKPTSAMVWFQNSNGSIIDSRGGLNWTTGIRDCDAPVGPRIVTWDPQAPDGCTPVTVRYYPNEGILQGSAQINIHIGRNGWVGTETLPMTNQGIYWEYTYDTPDETFVVNFVFNNGTTWDNNSGNDWNVTVANCSTSGPPPTVSTDPQSPVGCGPVTITYNPSGRPLAGANQVYIHIGYNGWQGVQVPNPPMNQQGSSWTYTYTPVPGTEVLNFVFNNGDGTWDNNNGADWFVNITDCDEGDPPPTGLAITNPAN
ncbi:MAG TPA: carbohydrate-binding protein, partial [Kiritimatiellia bacterium]|nr:carbohydrate-binding protein [Kiritimatiellia bacterium]